MACRGGRSSRHRGARQADCCGPSRSARTGAGVRGAGGKHLHACRHRAILSPFGAAKYWYSPGVFTRRAFLQSAGAAGTATVAAFTNHAAARLAAAAPRAAGRAAADLAEDEAYWRNIQEAFTLD